ncbi:YfhO family protein [Parabacteroides sp. PF5-9]|uniref:YfhO family protein n=1 Tax=Parabacteroides sp. PF5-9 TaxID=1742404 RepID=UPI0024730D87|nr:YfhO family protein [Parabacteroides sp. PF5-9]MDH6358710.1 hypothetical protein [Parabacteroides sp. PF5-9]
MGNRFKKIGGYAAIIALFAVLSMAYFAPVILDGKVLQQSDTQHFVGTAKELLDYHDDKSNKDIIAWQGNMFSGMPSYQVTVVNTPTNFLSLIGQFLSFLNYNDIRIVFLGLVCFFILMHVLGVNKWLAIGGSIAFAFASYNIIILVAGHITKAYVIAYMPLTLAGMILLFRSKYLWGSILFILGIALSIYENHLQITYYLMLLCICIYIGFLISMIKEKRTLALLKISGVMAACVILAVLPNIGNISANMEMSKTSTRGASELTTSALEGEKTSSGLDIKYAFDWSYGKGELLTILIPNVYGGASGTMLDSDSEFHKSLRSNGYQVGKEVQAPTYWGDKLFTSGPVYFGAVVCFLFLLGMFVIKNPMKWSLFAGALLLTFLALGRNMAWFNEFMFYHLPLYNNFRTPETALVIPGLVFPIIAFWGLKEIIEEKVDHALLTKGLICSVSITGIICLIVWLFPSLFLSFQSANYDTNYISQPWYHALIEDRQSLASADAFRSLLFILLSAGLLVLFLKAKEKKKMALLVCAGVGILTLADLWQIDKRYLSEKDFTHKKTEESFIPSTADNIILQDKDPSYRVLDLNNPFQNSNTSYFHHSIGGYHAAKLGRYQELIEHRLSKELNTVIGRLQQAQSFDDIYAVFANTSSLNMLNTRYIIYNPEQAPIRNPYAFGNAWFVSKYELVENADAEIEALNRIHPREVAVVDKRFADQLNGFNPIADATASIQLDSYQPHRMTYTSKTTSEQLAVFSEIYYQPGWKVSIDGQPVEHFRADYVLRAMRIPAGEHQIVFEFKPDRYITASYVSSYSSLLILLLLLCGIGYSIWEGIKKGKIDLH